MKMPEYKEHFSECNRQKVGCNVSEPIIYLNFFRLEQSSDLFIYIPDTNFTYQKFSVSQPDGLIKII